MSEKTEITLTFLPRHDDYFADLFEMTNDHKNLPGLSVGNTGPAEPADVNDFSKKMFVGMHGSNPGNYSAYRICCNGDGKVFTHRCDEDGRLTMGTDVENLEQGIVISPYTMQFIISYRAILNTMLEKAAKDIKKKMRKIEEEERSAPLP